ncbi:GerMN domain-containing protein [Brevibacillus fulvus]|uniref:Spore germination protein GerM n=1 Tax=Brevibacillus fulvus TaxID=1125967 RepID=A0A939BTK5_9BACL|nr:GerMN domain-containing protein [Brevibacillus fulvus]MBM7591603.1 spore germination protein GerM [Brevibacillus fulvus]
MKNPFAIVLLILLVVLAGCGKQATQPQSSAPAAPAAAEAQPQTAADTPAKPETPATQRAKVAIYFADNNLLELTKEEQEISYTDDVDKYKQVIQLLEKPAVKEHEALWHNFAYHSVAFANGTLTIDASGKNQYNLGSTGEGMAIDALQQTLFQFPEVKEIVILVDGQKADSLAGHVDISQPLTRS